MIACLRGELLHRSAEALVVEAGGVGYQVYFPQNRHHLLPEIGQETFLHIYTEVREDALNLYGFTTPAEKKMFKLLLGVSGVGPKLALNIVAGGELPALVRAIRTDDLQTLTRVPGVGKKTAERLCLELKEKVDLLLAVPELPPAAAVTGSGDQQEQDVISVLVNLGYPPARAREALENVRRQVSAEGYARLGLEELLRQALLSLA